MLEVALIKYLEADLFTGVLCKYLEADLLKVILGEKDVLEVERVLQTFYLYQMIVTHGHRLQFC